MSAAIAPVEAQPDADKSIGFGRLVAVELRKMFDTRAGFWLMASIVIVAVIASVCVILFVPDESVKYSMFVEAFGVPAGVLLPVIAIMSVTSEWSQRTGLVTFTQVPNRAEVIASKLLASVLIAIVAIPICFAVGALGNVAASLINGVDAQWDVTFRAFLLIMSANVLSLLIGFALGALFRNTAVAIVAYFVYAFVIPTILGFLAALQKWFADIQGWVNFSYASTKLQVQSSLSGEEWAQLGTSGLIWVVIPLVVGIVLITRSEVK